MNFIDLKGKTFDKWFVLEYAGQRKWKCRCECGTVSDIDGYSLRSGNSKSCGCYHKEIASKTHKKHGYTRTRLYRIYYKMKERCYRPSNDNYKWYGGSGITICEEWLHSFQAFCDWAMSNGYDEHLTIDRIDVSKNYCPENCRWLTIQEQQKNKRKRGTALCQ